MNTLELDRIGKLPNCTIGVLTYKDILKLYTIERPWLNNEPFKSCVSCGLYSLKSHNSASHLNSFYLENENLGVSLNGITIRTAILIHIANYVKDVVGCIGVGTELMQSRWGVSNSKVAMGLLNEVVNSKDDWNILIK